MTPSSRPRVRRLAGLVTAFATLLGVGVLAPVSALADDVTGFAISGTVTDDTGAPAVGIAVTVSPSWAGGPATTDGAGQYAAPNLSPGSYTVTFTPPSGSALLGETYDGAQPWNPTRVTVGSADVTGIDAALDRAATITGRTVDSDGNAIPGVGVQLQSAAFTYTTATTGEDGTFTASGLRPSDWRVTFTAPSGSGWVSEYYDDVLTWDAQTVVAVAPGATVTLNDAVLARGSTITGRILGPDGAPRPGIEVFAGSNESNGSGATTAADGTYSIIGLADGDYTVYAQPDSAGNLVSVVYPGSWNWQDAQPVHVSGAAIVELGDMTMVQGGTVSGTVLGPDGAPLANASVRALADHAENGTITGSDGSFSITLLPPGTYRVSAAGYFPVPTVRTYYAATSGVTRASQATPVVLATGGTAEGIGILAGAQGSATATIVATAAHPPVLGEPFTIDVTVSGAAGDPTGSVWVGTTVNGDRTYADTDLDASGHATLTFDAVDQGTYPWVDVTYVGDATYRGAAAMLDYVLGAAPPTVTSLAPTSATVVGGEPVTLSGTGFGPDTTVAFGGVTAGVTVDSPTSLVATAPAHAAGPVDVVVTTQGRSSAPVSFTYEKVATSLALTGPGGSTTSGAPAVFTATITSPTSPPSGSVSFAVDGGAPVSAPLVGGSAVLSTSILAAGPHSVVATFAGDANYGASSAQTTHTVTSPPAGPLPIVERAVPNAGLSTGGSLTVLTGKNFVKGKTTVSFGTVSTGKVTVLTSTALAVVVPKHSAGVVHVTVTTPAGRSTTWARFTYIAPPIWHPASTPFGPTAPVFESPRAHAVS